MPSIAPCLWFDGQAEEAAKHYVSIFPNSRITNVMRAPAGGPMPSGSAIVVNFELESQPYMALNGGPQYKFTEAISLFVKCETQAEVDTLWDKLVEGGHPGRCAWLKDKFGVSWQIVPTILGQLLANPDRQKAARVMAAMLQMQKIDIDKLKHAANAD